MGKLERTTNKTDANRYNARAARQKRSRERSVGSKSRIQKYGACIRQSATTKEHWSMGATWVQYARRGRSHARDLPSERAGYVEKEFAQIKRWQAQCSINKTWPSDERVHAVAAHLKKLVPSPHTLEEKMMANLCMHIAASEISMTHPLTYMKACSGNCGCFQSQI